MSGQQTLRLVALTALAETVKHLSGPILLGEMPSIVPSALPLFGSHLVDIRKAVVFLLVEIFMVVAAETEMVRYILSFVGPVIAISIDESSKAWLFTDNNRIFRLNYEA